MNDLYEILNDVVQGATNLFVSEVNLSMSIEDSIEIKCELTHIFPNRYSIDCCFVIENGKFLKENIVIGILDYLLEHHYEELTLDIEKLNNISEKYKMNQVFISKKDAINRYFKYKMAKEMLK